MAHIAEQKLKNTRMVVGANLFAQPRAVWMRMNKFIF